MSRPSATFGRPNVSPKQIILSNTLPSVEEEISTVHPASHNHKSAISSLS